jgi:hypothetical protein
MRMLEQMLMLRRIGLSVVGNQAWFVYLFSTTVSSRSARCCDYFGGNYFLRFRISSTRWTL